MGYKIHIHFSGALYIAKNEEKSAVSFFCQVAAWFSDMFCNFYFLKNHKIDKNSTTTKAREKTQIWNP
jgi:hypothetical protein